MRCALLGLAIAGPDLPAASAWRDVSAEQLRTAFVNHELADDVHYAYRFYPDGTFGGYELAREVRGRWRTVNGEFCWTWIRPRGSEECFIVQRRGNDVRFLRNGNEFLYGSLKALKPTSGAKGAR